MEWLLPWGLVGVMGVLLLSSVGLPVPEELTLATAGVLAGRGHALLVLAVLASYLGVLTGDALVWRIGRQVGASERLVSMVGGARFARISEAYGRYGAWLVLLVRPLPGMRVPVYLVAGATGMPLRRFVMVDAVAAAVTVPFYVGVGFWLADDLAALTETITRSRDVTIGLAVAAGLLVGGWLLHQWVRPTGEPHHPGDSGGRSGRV